LWAVAPLCAWAQSQFKYSRLEREDIARRLRHLPDKDEGDAGRRATLQRLFERAGCKGDDLTSQPVEGSDLANLICTLPATSDDLILVGAHFDAHPAGNGVIDNWTGAVLLPSLYQSLYAQPRNHTFVFIAFAAGASGHLGAKAYARSLSKEQAHRVRAFVCLESLGMTRTLAVNAGDGRYLLSLLKGAASAIMLPVDPLKPKQLGKTDAGAFANRKIPSLVIHSVSPYNFETRRGPGDSLEAVKPNEYFESYMLTAAFLAFADLKLK